MSLASLSPDKRREALIRVSQFVLRSEAGQLRQEVQEKAVETALFLRDSPCRLEEIIDVMRTRVLVDFPYPILKSILERLVEKNRVTFDGRYQLSSQTVTQIRDKTQVYSDDLENVKTQLRSSTEGHLGSKLSFEDERLVLDTFFAFLSALFLQRTEISARLIAGLETPEGTLIQPISLLDESLKAITNHRLRDPARMAILDLLRNPSEQLARFLLNVNSNLVCIQVLNLDPECRALEREAFSQVHLLLDTNAVISLVCPTNDQHRLSMELIDLTKRLGAKLLVTQRTLDEFLEVLEDANAHFQRLKIPQRHMVSIRDEFMASYAREKGKNPHLTWHGYYLTMKQIKGILEREYGVTFYENDHDEILKRTYFPEIAERVSECYEKIRGVPKKKHTSEHDAYHLLLVRELRLQGVTTMIGPSHWFLTHDQTLSCADPLVSAKGQYGCKTMSAMVAGIWLQMIEPFLTEDVRSTHAVRAFSELLNCEFASVGFRIDPRAIAEVQGPWLNYDWLETEDIEKILGESFVTDYVSRMEKMRAAHQNTEELTRQFVGQLDARVNSLAAEKIGALAEEVKELSKAVAARETRTGELEAMVKREEEFRRIWRSIAGIAGLVMIISNLVFIAYGALQFNEFTVAYFASTFIIGAILLFIAVAPENVAVKLGAILRFPRG